MLLTQEERGINPGGECLCDFDVFDDGDQTESVHYKRSCSACHRPFWSTHCIHEGPRSCGCLSSKASSVLHHRRMFTFIDGVGDRPWWWLESPPRARPV